MEHANPTSVDYLIYGKIIIDNIRLDDGSLIKEMLGGGGPQALFGALLWEDSVGFLSRSGTNIDPVFVQELRALGADLAGYRQYEDIETMYGQMMEYDENQYLRVAPISANTTVSTKEDWVRLLAQDLELPATYQANPSAIHLITEFPDEAMVKSALALKAEMGACFSLEPLIDYRDWQNKEGMLALLPQVDIVTPDWPSAAGFAGSNDPLRVLQTWASYGEQAVSIRHGESGSFTWGRGEDNGWHIPIIPVDVVDPTGAGNAYGGGWMVGWAKHHDSRIAGCYGAAAASFLVEQVGMPELTSAVCDEARKRLAYLLDKAMPL